jgi:hypothetical protein
MTFFQDLIGRPVIIQWSNLRGEPGTYAGQGNQGFHLICSD